MMELAELDGLVGRTFPGGTYTIRGWEHWLLCDVLRGPRPEDGVAHPLYIYMAALAGMGISVDDLFEWCGATAADGPMFGECELELRRPLRVGETVDVRGGITSVNRKEGKRTGVFDIVAFELELVGQDGDVAAVSRNSFVYPRRG